MTTLLLNVVMTTMLRCGAELDFVTQSPVNFAVQSTPWRARWVRTLT